MKSQPNAEKYRELLLIFRLVFGFFSPFFVFIFLKKILWIRPKLKMDKFFFPRPVGYLYSFPDEKSKICEITRSYGWGKFRPKKMLIKINPSHISGGFVVFFNVENMKASFAQNFYLEMDLKVISVSAHFEHLTVCFTDKNGCKIRIALKDHLRAKSGNSLTYRFHSGDFEIQGDQGVETGRRACVFKADEVQGFGFEYICESYLSGPDVDTEFVLDRIIWIDGYLKR